MVEQNFFWRYRLDEDDVLETWMEYFADLLGYHAQFIGGNRTVPEVENLEDLKNTNGI